MPKAKTARFVSVAFIDGLSKREVYSVAMQVTTPGEAGRCEALERAYKVAAARGCNVADRHVYHRISDRSAAAA